jgi:signal transduction histidine kinase
LARRTLKPIEDIHDAQSRFTADASHELRTPIAAMRLENELALSDNSLKLKDAKDLLSSNIEELDKLTSLTESLLQLATLDNEQLEKSKVKVKTIVQKAIERVQPEAESKKQLINSKNIDKGEISANKSTLIEALVTILDNAIKYSPEKSEIIVSTKRTISTIDFYIKDSGIGILPTDQSKIFDRFYRADISRQKNDISGYGIGLSIAKSVAESHGGNVSVESVPKKGSTFKISIPLK